MNTISLLGCGKLGYPLALQLLDKGYEVKGSTTTKSKIDHLVGAGIDSYLINVDENINIDFFNSLVLVITLPFKKSFIDPIKYKDQINNICKNIVDSKIRHIVFTSSSSVYPKDGKNYIPTDKFTPPNERSKILLMCEKMLSKINKTSLIIIRLGGIYGHSRNIISSNKIRRLISHDKTIALIMESIKRIGENEIINGFEMLVV